MRSWLFSSLFLSPSLPLCRSFYTRLVAVHSINILFSICSKKQLRSMRFIALKPKKLTIYLHFSFAIRSKAITVRFLWRSNKMFLINYTVRLWLRLQAELLQEFQNKTKRKKNVAEKKNLSTKRSNTNSFISLIKNRFYPSFQFHKIVRWFFSFLDFNFSFSIFARTLIINAKKNRIESSAKILWSSKCERVYNQCNCFDNDCFTYYIYLVYPDSILTLNRSRWFRLNDDKLRKRQTACAHSWARCPSVHFFFFLSLFPSTCISQ